MPLDAGVVSAYKELVNLELAAMHFRKNLDLRIEAPEERWGASACFMIIQPSNKIIFPATTYCSKEKREMADSSISARFYLRNGPEDHLC